MDVKEKIQLDKDLVKWLNRKRKLDSMKDEVAVLEVFDCIIPEIEKIYARKSEERDSYDEFGIDNVCGGVKSEDGIFFVKYALPSIIYYIYGMWLKSDIEKEEIFEELFTIGAGSMTHTYFPEVLPFCDECPDLCLTDSEIQSRNLKSFRFQKSNYYSNSYTFMDFLDPDDDDEMTKAEDGNASNVKPFIDDDEDDIPSLLVLEDNGKFVSCPADDGAAFGSETFPSDDKGDDSCDMFPAEKTNPFVSDSDTEDDDISGHNCDHCCESFPSAEFVKLHERIFHSKAVKARFVEEGVDLITSFVEEKGEASSDVMQAEDDLSLTSNEKKKKEAADGGSIQKKRKSIHDRSMKSKYQLRKSSKY